LAEQVAFDGSQNEDPLSDAALDALETGQAEPGPETPQPEPQVEVQVPDGTDVQVQTPDTEVQVEAPQGEPETKPKLFGKYETMEAAEQAWRDRERFLTQTRMEYAAKTREVEELQAFRQQAEPLLQQIQAAQQKPAEVQLPQPPADFDWTDPEQVRSYYGQLTQAQQQHFQTALQQERERISQQFQQQTETIQSQQAQQELGRTVAEFRSRHQDIDDIKALQIAEVFKENAEFGFTVSPENLELAHQVVSTPGVKQLLDRFNVVPDPANVARAQEVLADESIKGFVMANPSAFTDTDEEGWEAAKNYAARLAALNVETPPQQDPKALAKVTTGSGGAPAQAAPANNPYGIDPEMWKEFGGELESDPLAGLFNK
jgi:RNase H-fold protein (predicted Holliday junction resolvase)